MTSVALMVGVSMYVQDNMDQAFESVPEIDVNLEKLSSALPAVLIGDGMQVILVRNPTSSDELIATIAAASSAATDTLLLYYSGHGVVTANGGLALTHSRTSRALASYQAIDFDRVRSIFGESRARRRIVILDCCFSGAALGQTLDTGDLKGQAAIRGSYVMVSSPATRPSHVLPDEPMTAFTLRLLEVLRDGPTGIEEPWSLNQVFEEVRRRMIKDSLPEPQSVDNNAFGDHRILRRLAPPGFGSRQSIADLADSEHQRLRETGLVQILTDLNDEDNRQIVARIRRARNIFFCAHTGYNAMVSQYQPAIREAVRSGARLRVVITDPASPLMREEVLTRRLCPSIRQAGEINDVIETCARHQALAERSGLPVSNVQLKLYTGVPSMNMLQVDGWLRVIPYLPLVDAAESPVLEFDFEQNTPTPVIARYLTSMNMLWSDSRAVDLSARPIRDR